MRILLVVHGYPPGAGGGTEIYVRDLAVTLATSPGDDVFVLTRDADWHRPELSVRRSVDRSVQVISINNTFQSCASFEGSYTHPALRRIAAAIIDEIEPDVAHVQHLTCLSTGVVKDLTDRGVPVVMTLNDYWLICHRGQLLDLDGLRCSGPFDKGCGRCVPPALLAGPASYRVGRLVRTFPIPGAGSIVQRTVRAFDVLTPEAPTRDATSDRLASMQEAVRTVARFLAPSQTIADAFLRFGVPPERLIRCGQGIDLEPFRGLVRAPSPVLRVAFAGGLIPSKAPHVLLEAAARLPTGSLTIDLLGAASVFHGDAGYREKLEPWLKSPFLRRLGSVPHERMAAALSDVDLVVVPSVWIENAPFIIREACAAGAPVIASDLGGMAEMIRHEVDGLLVPPGDPEALASALARLVRDRTLLERLRAGIRPPLSIEDDAASLRGTYAELAGGARREVRIARREARVARSEGRVAAVVLNYRTADDTWLAVRALQTSFRRPEHMLIVDNNSGDGSASTLQAAFPGVGVIEAGTNAGFSGGCNIGIRAALEAGADYVVLVNSDAVVAPDAIGHLLAAAGEDRALGIVAPVLRSREEPDRIASAGITFSTRTGRMRHRAAGRRVSELAPGSVVSVDAVSGCVMLIRRAVFEQVGLLDEAYFFSFEDIDFCLRARAAGFRVACAQEAFVYHEGGRTIGRRSARRVYFATRNHLRLADRAGGRSGRRLRSGFVIGLNTAYVLTAPEAPLLSGLAAVARGVWHYAMGRYGPG